jgi:hypothetical protein
MLSEEYSMHSTSTPKTTRSFIFFPVDFLPEVWTNNQLLTSLSRSYQQVGNRSVHAKFRLHELKLRSGARMGCNVTRDLSDPLVLEGEHAYEVALLQLQIANTSLLEAIKALGIVIADVKETLLRQMFSSSFETAVTQNNVVSASECLQDASGLYYEILINHLPNISFRAIETAYNGEKARKEAREFVIKCSHNSSAYLYVGDDGTAPPEGPHMTFNEAQNAASRWIAFSNGVGDAVIENVTSRQFYSPDDGQPITGKF